MAMFPARSTARLGTYRWVVSGAYVAAWAVAAPTVPPVTVAWYQRRAATPAAVGWPTVWTFHSDSMPPRFVYWFCIISRATIVVLLLPPLAVAVTGGLSQAGSAAARKGPVNVDSEGRTQSTWNL